MNLWNNVTWIHKNMCSVNPLGGAGVGELTQVDGHVAVGAVHRRLETRHADLRASQHSLYCSSFSAQCAWDGECVLTWREVRQRACRSEMQFSFAIAASSRSRGHRSLAARASVSGTSTHSTHAAAAASAAAPPPLSSAECGFLQQIHDAPLVLLYFLYWYVFIHWLWIHRGCEDSNIFNSQIIKEMHSATRADCSRPEARSKFVYSARWANLVIMVPSPDISTWFIFAKLKLLHLKMHTGICTLSDSWRVSKYGYAVILDN